MNLPPDGAADKTRISRSYWISFLAISAAALGIRLASLPKVGFYCDVPEELSVIASGIYRIQFPGYVPFHLLIAKLARLGIPTFDVMWLLSLVFGMISLFYVMLAARRVAGDKVSLAIGLVTGLGILPVYFSVVGASYATDMVCAAGMLFHGWEFIRSRQPAQYYCVLLWFVFGILMRAASMAMCLPGIVCLLAMDWKASRAAVTALVLAATGALFFGLSWPYYGSLQAFETASRATSEAIKYTGVQGVLTNFFRFVAYPVYGFQLWLVLTVMMAWRGRGRWRKSELLYLVCVGGVYMAFLLRYIPHAGYYCLLAPAFILLPVCFAAAETDSGARFLRWACAFSVIALAQWFALRPITPKGLPTAIADAYFLQYSRAGIKDAMSETLSSISLRYQIDTNRIPEVRKQDVENMWRATGHTNLLKSP